LSQAEDEKFWWCSTCECEFDPDEEGVRIIERLKTKCLILLAGRAHDLRLSTWEAITKRRARQNGLYPTKKVNREIENEPAT
jgi:hypothetical protein